MTTVIVMGTCTALAAATTTRERLTGAWTLRLQAAQKSAPERRSIEIRSGAALSFQPAPNGARRRHAAFPNEMQVHAHLNPSFCDLTPDSPHLTRFQKIEKSPIFYEYLTNILGFFCCNDDTDGSVELRYVGSGIEFPELTDMKNIITSAAVLATLTTVASAADLPRRALPPAPVPLPVFTWTGAYFGINAGYITSTKDVANTAGAIRTSTGIPLGNYSTSVPLQRDGFTGGGQVGYNHQFTPGSGFVVGVEADAAYTDLRGRNSYKSNLAGTNSFRQSGDYLGTVRGRVGYAFDRTLVYATGGFAYAGQTYRASLFQTDIQPNYYGSRSRTETGYAVGGGVEYALPTDSFLNFFRSSAVTVKGEALYYDLGTRTIPVLPTYRNVNAFATRFQNEGVLGRVGVNYKFGSY
jgi:outer membrane immunogenic protein